MTRSRRLLLALTLAPLSLAQNQFQTDVLALNPLGFWPLSGNANDSSSHGGNGLLNGTTFSSNVPSPIDSQFAVFNNGQFISLTPSGSAVFNLASSHAFTVMAWIRTLGLRHMTIVSKSDNNAGWAFGIDSGAGRFSLLFGSAGTLALGAESGASVNDGDWHLVAATYDGSGQGSGIKFYLDGVPVSATTMGSLNGSILNSSPLTIGGDSDGVTDLFNGYINDVAVFGAALTPSEILQLAEDATPSAAVLSQFAFGGGWYSAVYFSNTSSNPVSFTVNFKNENGGALSGIPGGSSQAITLAAGASTIIEAPNMGANTTVGYVTANLPIGVTAYGIFRQTVGQVGGLNVPDQEGTAPFSYAFSGDQTFAFDETNFNTGVAIVNTSTTVNTVTVTAFDASGTQIGITQVVLQPSTHYSNQLRLIQGLGQVVGKRGRIVFSSSQNGSVVALGIRFNNLSFTSIPTVSSRQVSKFVGEPFF